MLAVLIMVVVASAVAAAAAFGGLQLLEASTATSQAQLNLARLDEAAVQLRKSLRNIGGVLRPPAGELVGGYTILPRAIFPNAVSPWGVNFHYCPFAHVSAVAGGTAGTVTYPGGGGTYNIRSIALAAAGGVNYVQFSDAPSLASGTAPGDLVGFVVAPILGQAQPPRCNQIAYDAVTDNFTLPNGVVRAIRANQAIGELQPMEQDHRVLFVATESRGDGTGRDEFNPMTLDEALTAWRDAQPQFTTIRLAAGSYAPATNLIQYNDAGWTAPISPLNARNITLRLVGNGNSGPNRSLIDSAAGVLRWPSHVVLENLETEQVDVPPGQSLILRTARTSNITVTNGRLYSEGSTIQPASGDAILGVQSDIVVSGVNNITAATAIRAIGGSLTVNPSGGTINVSNHAFDIQAGANAQINYSASANIISPGATPCTVINLVHADIQLSGNINIVCDNSLGSGNSRLINMQGGRAVLSGNISFSAGGGGGGAKLADLEQGAQLHLEGLGFSIGNDLNASGDIITDNGAATISGSGTIVDDITDASGLSPCFSGSGATHLFSASTDPNNTAPDSLDLNYNNVALRNRSAIVCSP